MIEQLSGGLRELALFLAGSPRSRLRQLAAVRDLSDHHLADIGLTRWEALNTHALDTAGIAVRDAGDDDMTEIAGIYGHHVLRGSASFEEVPPTIDEMRRRRDAVSAAGLPWLVAHNEGRVVGYCYAGPYRPRAAYRHTIENSVYVRAGLAGHGIGSELLAALIRRCEGGPWRQMVAVIGDSGNAGSIALHRRHGFRAIGTLEAVGFKHGAWVDSVLMQRSLGPGRTAPP